MATKTIRSARGTPKSDVETLGMARTFAVNPESWDSPSAHIRRLLSELNEGSLNPLDARESAIGVLQALADDTPDSTGYLESLATTVQESPDEKLATKIGLIATEIATQADVAVGLDAEHIPRLGLS
ncbi:hypothetical protein JF770_15015 [Mycobacterium intracellulare]|uniref:hypothetical protein n=1 Tax=Mycobacterium intracellulare TaxID=1767 RepID=UPI001CD9E7DF|nr:hypothetical protein [Mycobacterium intracellulare]MCA2304876.1 hypothetical protein [Mycobacterium intracellulare]MCA2347093.1 hypothetical protein [Mycobacterium intracellulare]